MFDDDFNIYFRSTPSRQHSLEIAKIKTLQEILAEAKEAGGHKFYKITVAKFYLFDTIESKPSQKYELDWTKS